jgi:DNA-binding HxlR family transcriptional regulator
MHKIAQMQRPAARDVPVAPVALAAQAELCPRFHRAVELIGRRWTGAIVQVLLGGSHRFIELKESVPGISERLLVQRLRELVAEGLVLRRVLPGPPVGVEYELTDAGRDLEGSMAAVGAWATRWLPDPAATKVG